MASSLKDFMGKMKSSAAGMAQMHTQMAEDATYIRDREKRMKHNLGTSPLAPYKERWQGIRKMLGKKK